VDHVLNQFPRWAFNHGASCVHVFIPLITVSLLDLELISTGAVSIVNPLPSPDTRQERETSSNMHELIFHYTPRTIHSKSITSSPYYPSLKLYLPAIPLPKTSAPTTPNTIPPPLTTWNNQTTYALAFFVFFAPFAAAVVVAFAAPPAFAFALLLFPPPAAAPTVNFWQSSCAPLCATGINTG
jgi:hypothetical protein